MHHYVGFWQITSHLLEVVTLLQIVSDYPLIMYSKSVLQNWTLFSHVLWSELETAYMTGGHYFEIWAWCFQPWKMHRIILLYLAGAVLTFAPRPPLSHGHDAAAGKLPCDRSSHKQYMRMICFVVDDGLCMAWSSVWLCHLVTDAGPTATNWSRELWQSSYVGM